MNFSLQPLRQAFRGIAVYVTINVMDVNIITVSIAQIHNEFDLYSEGTVSSFGWGKVESITRLIESRIKIRIEQP